MAISKEKKMKLSLSTPVMKAILVLWKCKLLSLLGKSTTSTTTSNNIKKTTQLTVV